ncbi:MAG TPA: hypothetical protein PLI45_03675 [Candidatus Woesebacteria bacterium]|nr:hypothetical protein [Candidatus Woesebacteria bacterium]
MKESRSLPLQAVAEYRQLLIKHFGRKLAEAEAKIESWDFLELFQFLAKDKNEKQKGRLYTS